MSITAYQELKIIYIITSQLSHRLFGSGNRVALTGASDFGNITKLQSPQDSSVKGLTPWSLEDSCSNGLLG